MILMINQRYLESQNIRYIIQMQKKKPEKEVFNEEKEEQFWLKKVKQMHGEKTLATTKFQNPIGKTIFERQGKGFMSYPLNCTHICRKNQKSQGSVDVVSYTNLTFLRPELKTSNY